LAKLDRAALDSANLQDTQLVGTQLCGAALVGADLRGAWLAGADLQEARLDHADFRGAQFGDANMQDGKLYILDGAEGMQKPEAFWELLKLIFCKIEDERSGVLSFYATPSERGSATTAGPAKARIQKVFEDKVAHRPPRAWPRWPRRPARTSGPVQLSIRMPVARMLRSTQHATYDGTWRQ
jgi:hypothetical protein